MKNKNPAPQDQGAVKRGSIRTAQLVEVIKVTACIGKGTEEDPNRIITEYWSKDGRLLAVSDPSLTSIEHRPSLD